MVFEFFGEVTTSPDCSFYSMSNTTIISFNTYGKKLTDLLSKAFKPIDKTVPSITGYYCTSYAKLLKWTAPGLSKTPIFGQNPTWNQDNIKQILLVRIRTIYFMLNKIIHRISCCTTSSIIITLIDDTTFSSNLLANSWKTIKYSLSQRQFFKLIWFCIITDCQNSYS